MKIIQEVAKKTDQIDMVMIELQSHSYMYHI